MTATTNNLPINPQSDDIDDIIALLVTKYPTVSLMQIGKKLTRLGVIKQERAIYRHYNKSELLRKELSEVEANVKEFIGRKIIPQACKRVSYILSDKAKKNKDVTPKEQANISLQFLKQQQDSPAQHSNTITINEMNFIQNSLTQVCNKALENIPKVETEGVG